MKHIIHCFKSKHYLLQKEKELLEAKILILQAENQHLREAIAMISEDTLQRYFRKKL